MMPSSRNTGVSIVFRGSSWRRSITSSQRVIPSGRTQGDSLLSTCSGQVLPLGRRPSSSSPSSPSPSLSAAGSSPKACAGASTVTGSSCQPSLWPSCQGRLPERGPVPLSPEAPVFTPWKQLNGSGPPQVGKACWVPTSLVQDPLSSCRSPSSHQFPMMDRRWSVEGTPLTLSPGQILVKPSPTTVIPPLPSLRVSSRSATMNRSQGERVPGRPLLLGQPQCLAPLPGRDSPLPPQSRSQRRNSSLFPLGGRHSMPQSQLSIPSGKLLGRRDPPKCFPGKTRPAHSVCSYNEMG